MNSFSVDTVLDQISTEMQPACEIIDFLHNNGYTEHFELVNDLLMCTKNHHHYKIKEMQVDHIYRFDDGVGILDGLILYAIHEPYDDLKGIFIAR